MTAAHALPLRDFPRPAGIVEAQVDALSGMLPGEFTTQTVTEVFAAGAPADPARTRLHRRLMVEALTGKIWQPGCGDPVLATPDPAATPQPGATPAPPLVDERVYLDLSGYEAGHPTWEEANLAWIERLPRQGEPGAAGAGARLRRPAGADPALHPGRGPDLDAVAQPLARPRAPRRLPTATPTETPIRRPRPVRARRPRP